MKSDNKENVILSDDDESCDIGEERIPEEREGLNF